MTGDRPNVKEINRLDRVKKIFKPNKQIIAGMILLFILLPLMPVSYHENLMVEYLDPDTIVQPSNLIIPMPLIVAFPFIYFENNWEFPQNWHLVLYWLIPLYFVACLINEARSNKNWKFKDYKVLSSEWRRL